MILTYYSNQNKARGGRVSQSMRAAPVLTLRCTHTFTHYLCEKAIQLCSSYIRVEKQE